MLPPFAVSVLASCPSSAWQRGFCEVTQSAGDCEALTPTKGSWKTKNAASCTKRCRGCKACNFVSYSEPLGDCSWFSHCNVMQLQGGDSASHCTRTLLRKRKRQADRNRRTQYLPHASFRQYMLPPTLVDRVDVSVLMQYWGGGAKRSVGFAANAANFVKTLVAQLEEAQLSYEVLLNSDSRSTRLSDARTLLDGLVGQSTFLVLSPNIGEARAYNRMARLSRGEHLLMVQDGAPPQPEPQ